VGNYIIEVLEGLAKNGADNNSAVEKSVAERVLKMCQAFPIYPAE
jgi:glycine hydroxymethyltransferase